MVREERGCKRGKNLYFLVCYLKDIFSFYCQGVQVQSKGISDKAGHVKKNIDSKNIKGIFAQVNICCLCIINRKVTFIKKAR